MAIAPRMATISQVDCTCPTRTITVVMLPGPASMGMPMGTMPASSLVAAAWASLRVSCVGERLASSMSRPMSRRMTPPAISNAGKRDAEEPEDVLADEGEERKHDPGGE